MTNLVSMLPYLDGWEWARESTSKNVNGGSSIAIEIEKDTRGWAYSAALAWKFPDSQTPVSSLELPFQVQFDTFTIESSFKELNAVGQDSPSGFGAYLSKYDTQNGVLGVRFGSDPPLSFQDVLALEGENDRDHSLNGTAYATYVRVVDDERFLTSLKQMLGSDVKVEQVLQRME